jgi:Tol biopolymer transport system component
MKSPLFVAALAATTVLAAWAAKPATGKLPSNTKTGAVGTPRNFPKQNADDLRDMFQKSSELGSFAVVRVNWNDPNRVDAAKILASLAQQQSLAPVVELSPFKEDGLKASSLDPGNSVPGAKGRLSFADQGVSDAYSKTILDLAAMKPPYLGVATNVNLYAQSDPAGFSAFARMYSALYPQIKRISPNTKVFVTFQWDALQGQGAAARSQVDAFGPNLDLLAFTSDPRKLFAKQGPSGVPADYYSRISQYQSGARPVFLEVNWPSEGHTGEADQAAFIHSLPDLTSKVDPSMLAWTFLYDVRIAIFTVRAGLIGVDGTQKSGFAAFKEISGDRPAPVSADAAAPAAPARSAISTASKAPAYFGIYTARLDGSDVQTIMTNPDHEMTHPRVSPDGKRLVLTSYNDTDKDGRATEGQGYANTQIMIMNLDGSGVETIIPPKPGVIAANGSWTPDGDSLIFISTDDPQHQPEIHKINLATRKITRVPTPAGKAVADPNWVGNNLVFPVLGGGADSLWTMNADGSNAQQVTHPTPSRKAGSTDNFGDFDPKLSPDDSKIAFMRIFGGTGWRVMVVDLKTSQERDLTSSGGVIEGLPTWSSDGKLLLYRHIDQKKIPETGLYTMTPDGNDRKMVPLPRGFLYNHGSFFPGDGSSSKARIIYTGTRVPGF